MAQFTPNVDLTVIKRLFGAVQQPGGFIVSDVISPVIEVQDIALFARREFVTFFSTLFSLNAPTTTVVPQGEFWLVHFITMDTDILDGDQAIAFQLVILPAGQATRDFRIGPPSSVAANEAGGIGQAFTPPLILPAGTTFGVVANQITVGAGGSIAVGVNSQITRITI